MKCDVMWCLGCFITCRNILMSLLWKYIVSCRKEGLAKCGKCKKAFYCNVKCQVGKSNRFYQVSAVKTILSVLTDVQNCVLDFSTSLIYLLFIWIGFHLILFCVSCRKRIGQCTSWSVQQLLHLERNGVHQRWRALWPGSLPRRSESQ